MSIDHHPIEGRRPIDQPRAEPETLDRDGPGREVEDLLGVFAADQAAAMHSATVVLGEKLGLFRALAEGGAQTPQQLADRTGYRARLVDEWLRAQAVSGYCENDQASGTFWLTPAQRACLAEEGSPSFVAGGVRTVSAVHRAVDRVAAVFRGEDVLPWEDQDPDLFIGVAGGFRPAFETHLVASWIPALDGIEARLRAGGRVADVACGFGVTSVLLAEAYPASVVSGFDTHEVSIETARRAAAEAGVADRLTFEVAEAAGIPGGDYDLICIFNALHEMGDPVGVCRHLRGVLAEAGSVMLVEPIAGERLTDNRTPVGRSFTSGSTMVCLPSALSQGGGWHLGAQAPDAEFAAVAEQAGFGSAARVAETPLHRVLELRG